MVNETEIIDLLRHSRHDWLNAIQLIKGNLALNHIDRAKEIIDILIMKSKNEAKLSNLNMPMTAGFLLTYNWYSHAFKLDIEVIGNHVDLSSYDEILLKTTRQLIELMEKHSSSRTENHVLFTVQIVDEEKYLSIDFSGLLEEINQFKQSFNNLTYHSMVLTENYIKEDEVLLTFQIQEDIDEVE